MKKGKILCLLCENSVPDFATTFNDVDGRITECTDRTDRTERDEDGEALSSFPSVLFQDGGYAVAQGPWPRRLFRKDDLEAGIALPREGFGVLLTTRFKPEEFEEYFFSHAWGLPKPKSMYQAIIIEYEPGSTEMLPH